MLRSATRGTASKQTDFSLKAFSTWLNTHHVPKSTAAEIIDALDRNIASSSLTTRRSASTRASRFGGNDNSRSSSAPVPRYIRRQQLQDDSPRTVAPPRTRPEHVGGESSTPKKPTEFRSKHFEASENATPKAEMRLLEPHVLSSRLKKLCDDGKLDDAVHMLKNMPLDAQNTPVWNTLIWEALKAERYKLAYDLFTDMKRRGFSPSVRTFQTFFTGLARIDDWAMFPKQLVNARSLYANYQRLVESIMRHDPKDPDLSSDPLSGYIRVLGKAGQYQDIFDVYYALEKSGPLAPNKFVYTAMFNAMVAAQGDTVEGSVKVASDARLVWTQMIKASQKDPNVAPDSHTVVAAINALSGGNKVDFELALKIITEYFGLVPKNVPSSPGLIPLGPEALNAILRFCNRSQQYSLCNIFVRQVKRRPESSGGVTILDRFHMEEQLKADLAQTDATALGHHAVEVLEWMLRQEITAANGPKIRPALGTYHLVMQACWRSADWNSAMRTFDLMTGFHAHDFKDGAVAQTPRFDQRGPGKNLPPNTEIMSYLLRTALLTKNRADIRQGLRIVDYLGFEALLRARSHGGQHQETMKAIKHRALFGKKLGAAIVESVEYIMAEGGKFAKPAEAKRWTALAAQARAYIKSDGGVAAAAGEAANAAADRQAEEGEEKGRGFTSKAKVPNQATANSGWMSATIAADRAAGRRLRSDAPGDSAGGWKSRRDDRAGGNGDWKSSAPEGRAGGGEGGGFRRSAPDDRMGGGGFRRSAPEDQRGSDNFRRSSSEGRDGGGGFRRSAPEDRQSRPYEREGERDQGRRTFSRSRD